MKTTVHADGHITLRVSRRNLLTLLAKLDGNPPDSACTILGPIVWPATTLIAEEDDVHYNDADRVTVVGDNRPGEMHPVTEATLAATPLPGYRVAHADAGATHYVGETA